MQALRQNIAVSTEEYTYSVDDFSDVLSVDAVFAAKLSAKVGLELTSGTTTAVPLGGLASIGYLFIRSSLPCVARITTTAGTTQSIPFNSVLLLESKVAPITALDVTRSTTDQTSVRIFMAELA